MGPDSRATAPGIPRNGMNLQKKQVLQQNFASRVCGFFTFCEGVYMEGISGFWMFRIFVLAFWCAGFFCAGVKDMWRM